MMLTNDITWHVRDSGADQPCQPWLHLLQYFTMEPPIESVSVKWYEGWGKEQNCSVFLVFQDNWGWMDRFRQDRNFIRCNASPTGDASCKCHSIQRPWCSIKAQGQADSINALSAVLVSVVTMHLLDMNRLGFPCLNLQSSIIAA